MKIRGLQKYKDLCVESVLATGDKTLSFLYPARLCKEIEEEGYIRTKTDEFVIKEIQDSGEYKSIKAILNVEELEGKTFESFEAVEVTIGESIRLALAGTGWTLGDCNITKRRTIRKTNSSSLSIIQEAKKVYRAEYKFDTINKTINIYDEIGSDKGVYLKDSLNLVSLDVQSNSYDFYTRIKAFGKTIKNDSDEEVQLKVIAENFQYSKKIKELIWKDERYIDVHSLREDAEAKLKELSKPYLAYAADVIDLSKMNIEYKDILNYELGDTITLVSSEKGIREKQRIVKLIEYPNEPSRNKCEIANTTLNFEDIQKGFQDTTNVVNNITSDDGTISEDAISDVVKKLTIDKINVNELNAVKATIGELDVNKLNADEANIKFAKIDKAIIGKAEITDLEAATAKIGILEATTAEIGTLVNGNLTSDNIHSLNLTTDKVTVANGFIKNAMIDTLNASKINSGEINTNNITICSESGGIQIADSTQQFKDKNNKVRLQMGQDATGEFSFMVLDETGKGTIIDHTGVKEKAIADGLIKEKMIGDGEIGGKKINISSMIEEVNKDTNTKTIKGSKILLDTAGQTLEVGFNQMKTNVENIDIGGRNLVFNSSWNTGINKDWTTNNNFTILEPGVDKPNSNIITISKSGLTGDGSAQKWCKEIELSVVNKNEFTVSFDFKTPRKEDIDSTNCIFCIRSYEEKGKTSQADAVWYKNLCVTDFTKMIVNGKWCRLSYTFKVATGKFLRVGIYQSRNGIAYWREIQLTTGNKLTDYVPAIEDTKEEIETISTQLKVEQGRITTAIENTKIKKDGKDILLKDDYSRTVQTVDENRTNIGTHTTQISGLDKKVTTANSDITQLKDKITLKVEATEVNKIVTDKVDEITFSGRNLILNSNFDNTLLNWRTWGSATGSRKVVNITDLNGFTKSIWFKSTSTGEYGYAQDNINIEKGETYILSAYIKCIGTSGTVTLQEGNSTDKWTSTVFNVSELKKWTRVQHKFKARGTSLSAYLGQNTAGAVGVDVYITGVQLEHSTKISDWKNALEDTESKIESVKNVTTKLTTDLEGITGKVTKSEKDIITIDGKVVKQETRLTTAENKITDSAIVNTVKKSQTNGKDTFAQTSKVEQLVDKVKFNFESSGGYNIVENSTGQNLTNRCWGNTSNNSAKIKFAHSSDNTTTTGYYIRLDRDNETDATVNAGVSKRFKLKPSTKYTVSAMIMSNAKTLGIRFMVKTSNTIIYTDSENRKDFDNTHTVFSGKHTAFSKESLTFTTGTSVKSGCVFFEHMGYDASDKGTTTNRIYWADVMLVEGETAKQWSPHPSEIYSGSTTIDATGVTVNNGALTVKNKSGKEVIKATTTGDLLLEGRLKSTDGIIGLMYDSKIDNSQGILRLQYDKDNYLSIQGGGADIYSYLNKLSFSWDANNHFKLQGNRNSGILKQLNSNTDVQARNQYDSSYARIIASAFNVNTSKTTDILYSQATFDEISYIDILKENNIVNYREATSKVETENRLLSDKIYGDVEVIEKEGFIVDLLTPKAKDIFVTESNGDNVVDITKVINTLWRVSQEQQLMIEELKREITKIELRE